ncbi:hypothetical protein ACFPYJ_10880 [Paenibacillus solisilvae]|uniref:Uncharacterized protein n=1 Tax=Paenibacillus solisilvae TaxID=2486751 RepID=A0ABW0VZL0_9BACL
MAVDAGVSKATLYNNPAAKEFFLDFGLEVQGEWESEGEWMDQVVGLNDVKVACVGLRTPDGQAWIELIKFYTPSDALNFMVE